MNAFGRKYYFSNYQRRLFFLYGKIHDRFCLPGLELLDLDEVLHRQLRSLGYRRIIFYRGGHEKISFLDYDSKRLSTARPREDSSGRSDRDPYRRFRVCAGPLGSRKMLPLPAPDFARAQVSPEEKNGGALHLGGMSDVEAVLLLDYCMGDSSCKTAVIFSDGLDFITQTDENAVRRLAGSLSRWKALEPVDNENICLFLFPDLDLAVLKELLERYPEWSFLNSLMYGQDGQPADAMIPLGSPHRDEVENFIHYWRISRRLQPEWNRLTEVILAETRRLRSSGAGLSELAARLKDVPVEQGKGFTAFLGCSDGKPALEKLRSMHGLEAVLEWMEALLLLQRERECLLQETPPQPARDSEESVERLLPPAPAKGRKPNLHLVLVGNPGTGKTTVANLIGEIYREAGLLELGHTVKVTRTDLVAGYVGQTALKTAGCVADAMDGVLFVDEAYSLVEGGEGDFGREAVTTFMEAMSAREGRFAVVLAGYPDRMESFLESNPGLRRRFGEANIINIPDYKPPVLQQIFEQKIGDPEFFGDGLARSLDPQFKELLASFFINWYAARDPATFGNAGSVEQLIEEMERLRVRRTTGIDADPGQSYTFTAEDVPASCRKHLRPLPASFEAALAGLNRLVGLRQVKQAVATLMNRMKIEKLRSRERKVAPGHYVFTGNPGTGKTTVARQMGEMFRLIGLLERGHVVEVRRSDLVGAYQGHSARQTRERLQKALDGVLFIDEAYQLILDEGDTFGREARGELLQFMENNRERISIIVAGYPGPMQRFLNSDPGLASRFSETIVFENYTAEEMLEIFKLMAGEEGFTLGEGMTDGLAALFARWEEEADEHFGNAREVRKLFEATCNHQSNRLARRKALAPGDVALYCLERADIPEEAAPAEPAPVRGRAEAPFIPLSANLLPKSYPGVGVAAGGKGILGEPHLLVEPALLFLEAASKEKEANGSGFIISSAGLALTCQHVVEGATSVRARVRRPEGEFWHDCRILKAVPGIDLALIKLEGEIFAAAVLAGPEERFAKGHPVGVLGYPLGEQLAEDANYTEGNITSHQSHRHGELVQISAQVYHGSSGCPVFSRRDGRVLGLIIGALDRPDAHGINFFRPIRYVWQLFFAVG